MDKALYINSEECILLDFHNLGAENYFIAVAQGSVLRYTLFL